MYKKILVVRQEEEVIWKV